MRSTADVDPAVLATYETFKLMQLFRLTHPDQLRALPAPLVVWGQKFEQIEHEARAAARDRENRSIGG